MTRILLLAEPAIRNGLRMRLALEPDVTIVGEAGDGLAALSLAYVHQPDVIVMEMESIGMDSVELIKAIRTTSPGTAPVILSLRGDSVTRSRVEAAGAAAFVSKHENADRLLQVIRKVATGQHEPLVGAGELAKVRTVRS